jgi:tetratricopeptide (TPR) repeat protein
VAIMTRALVTAVSILLLGALAGCGAARRHHATIQQEGEGLRRELAELYVARGAETAAIPLLRRLLADQPTDARALVLYGTVLRDRALYPQGERALRRALELDGARADAHAALAILLELTGRTAEARAHHQRAVALAPGEARFRNNLGFALLLADQPAAAIPQLEAALQLDPALGPAYANLGFAYGRAGRLDDAERAFRAGLGEAAALHDLALVRDERGEHDLADELRRRAWALDPDLRTEEAP